MSRATLRHAKSLRLNAFISRIKRIVKSYMCVCVCVYATVAIKIYTTISIYIVEFSRICKKCSKAKNNVICLPRYFLQSVHTEKR